MGNHDNPRSDVQYAGTEATIPRNHVSTNQTYSGLEHVDQPPPPPPIPDNPTIDAIGTQPTAEWTHFEVWGDNWPKLVVVQIAIRLRPNDDPRSFMTLHSDSGGHISGETDWSWLGPYDSSTPDPLLVATYYVGDIVVREVTKELDRAWVYGPPGAYWSG